MKWFEPIIIIFAVFLVVFPIVSHVIKKKNGTLKCECGHYRNECTGDCGSCHNRKDKSRNKNYLTYVIHVNGMKCSMCESHINTAIRNEFDVLKVKSSRKNNTVSIKANHLLNISLIKEKITSMGYEVVKANLA